MATYLPVLLLSVNAGMPDDASLQPLPRGQVDYLSHDWNEEDCWLSWRNMTKQKNEIANGVRLENASWRTWWKQRNKLRTVSPETLNWLKDSDVTWLYGPLHTAVEWVPLGKAPMTPPNGLVAARKQGREANSSRLPNCISSPSSSINLDRYSSPVSRYGSNEQQQQTIMKPILKHRSIAEMLSSTLPPTPTWSDDGSVALALGDVEEEDEEECGRPVDELRSIYSGKAGRPPMFHTKSDTHLLPQFKRKKAKTSPPRVAPTVSQREPESVLSASQRINASNNLAEMAWNAAIPSAPAYNLGWPSATQRQSPQATENSDSSGSEPGSGRSDTDVNSLSPTMTQLPQKKHISFNAIVEQCIAIDSAPAPMSPSTLEEESWPGYDDGYTEDNEDGLYEDIRMQKGSDSDDQRIDEEDDDDDALEIKPPSRRGSTGSFQGSIVLQRSRTPTHPSLIESQDTSYPARPPLHRSSTSKSSGPSKSGRRANGSSSRRGSTSTSQNRSRSSLGGTSDREHVSIAPIAPTILKTAGTEDGADDVLYIGAAGLHGNISQHGSGGASTHSSNSIGSGNFAGGLYSSFGYGYGGYGYGERVSEGRSDAYEHFERGTEAGELVYQSPNGNIYPWEENDALRYRMRSEYGIPSPATSPPKVNPSPPQARAGLTAPSSSTNQAIFIPDQTSFVSSLSMDTEGAEFEYLDTAESEPESHDDNGPAGGARVLRVCEDLSGVDRRDGSAQLIMPFSNGSADSIDQRSPTLRTVGRTPSPDFQPKVNPRIASLKSEGAYRTSSSSNLSATAPDNITQSTTTATVPIPGVSLVNQHDTSTQSRSPPESPVPQAGPLSPPDMSPGRGRSICTSPVSGYLTSGSATTSSGVFSDTSRSISDSRSDSRGRSRTRNSSISTSDQEPERGRSRSRSTASGANSPLSDSSSPHARYPPMVIGIGSHSGREIHDGRGVRLYRKTSEDFMGAGSSSSPSSSSPRGRNREGRRVSESLSPPVGTGVADALNKQGAVSPPSYASYRPMPSSGLGLQSYSAQSDRNIASGAADDHPSSNSGTPVVQLPRTSCPAIGRGASGDSISSISSSSSSTSIAGRLLPPSIPEEDERLKLESPTSDTYYTVTALPVSDTQTKSEPSSLQLDEQALRVKTNESNPPSKGANELCDPSLTTTSSQRSKANGAFHPQGTRLSLKLLGLMKL